MNTHLAEHIANELGKAAQSGNGWVCCCPAHDDENPSLSITDADNGKVLVCCHAGCEQKEVIDKLKQLGLWTETDTTEATYNYVDTNSNLLHQVVRYKNKKFWQRRPDGNDSWVWDVKGIEKVPYRLPQLLTAIKAGQTIFIVEGEKDCDNLALLGLTATTNSGGAGNWHDGLSEHFKGAKEVYILPDNDKAGHDHGNEVAVSLYKLGLLVKLIPLPGLPAKGDVSDWLNAGGTKEQLLQLCADAPQWTPENALIEQDSMVQPLSPGLTDIGNAERFKKMFGAEVLWVPALGKWFVWSGKNWVIDDLEKVFDYAKKVAVSVFEEVNYG